MLVLKPPQSGSIAGVTASHNRFGQYERSRRTPVQPTLSERQSTAKSNFAAASSAFAQLTGSQILAWNAYAEDHPVVNALGQSVKLTGHMMFVSINAQRFNVGADQLSDPPDTSEVFAPTGIVVTADAGPNVSIAFDAVAADSYLLVSASRPVSPAVSFNKTFRQMAVAVAAADEADITAAWLAGYGTVTEGLKIFFKLTPVNSRGVTGIPVIVSAIIAASP